MKKILKIGISVVAVTLMFSFLGCEKNSSEIKEASKIERLENKEEIIVGVGQSMLEKGFDPCKGWGNYGVTLIQSKLLDFDFENNIIKDLAENYEVSEDGKTWIFKIREDVKFSDGQKLTAKDVAFTFNKTKEIGTTFDFKLLEKAEALDDKTVKFTFSAPSSTFIYNAANLGIVAEHAYKDTNTYSSNPIGSGPYKLVSYTQGQQLILDRNEEYYGTKPKFKRLTLVAMTPDTALASIKAGDIDIVNVSEAMAQEKIENYKKILEKISSQEEKQKKLLDELKKLEDKSNRANLIRNEVGKMGRAISKYMLSGISNIASLNFNKITGRTERIEWSNDEKDKYVLYLVGQERKIAFEQLSGGEQVSVAIAIRGTMTEYFTNSRFMILDEPTNNLDTERKKLLAEYMGEILKNLDQSIIVTHDDTFREMAEKIIEL